MKEPVPCSCPLAGWCERHRLNKTDAQHKLCQTRANYRKAWDEGRLFGQKNAKPKQPPKLISMIPRHAWPMWAKTLARFARPTDYGVGDTAERVFAKLGGEQFKALIGKVGLSCGCTARRDDWNVKYVYCLPPIDIVFVTSLSPLGRHRVSQHRALTTWKRMGVYVVSVNTSDEVSKLKDDYACVDKWIVSEDQAEWCDRKTQSIRSLFAVALKLDKPIFIINSDIEVEGDQQQLLRHRPNGLPVLGIRWNYQHDDKTDAQEFQYGFDIVGVTPEQAKRLPEDFPYGIGQPVWDYAAPMILSDRFHVVHEPLFYHRNHPLNWSDKAWQEGAEHFKSLFGEEITCGNTPVWRQRFEPEMIYSMELGKYVRRTCDSLVSA